MDGLRSILGWSCPAATLRLVTRPLTRGPLSRFLAFSLPKAALVPQDIKDGAEATSAGHELRLLNNRACATNDDRAGHRTSVSVFHPAGEGASDRFSPRPSGKHAVEPTQLTDYGRLQGLDMLVGHE